MAGEIPQRRPRIDPEGQRAERERLVAAFAKAVAEHGFAALDLNQVLRYAGVDRDTLEAHFATKEQGLLAAQDAFFERLWLDVISACDAPIEWPLKVRAGLVAALSSLCEASNLARVFAVEAAAASLAAAERQYAALDEFASLLQGGRRHYPEALSLPVVTERAIVGGVASIVSSHLLMEDPRAIPVLQTQLVELVLLPYVGQGEARRVASG